MEERLRDLLDREAPDRDNGDVHDKRFAEALTKAWLYFRHLQLEELLHVRDHWVERYRKDGSTHETVAALLVIAERIDEDWE